MKTESNVTPFPEEESRSSLSEREIAIRRLADQMHRLNHAIVQAVEAGVSVELMRCSRYHSGNGLWGDQMQPIVTVTETKQ
jgi:hypothetical protein